MKRSILNYFGLLSRGLAMGAADVVPGVSGGTIAFITGIYEELIHSIKSIGPKTLVILKNKGLRAAWDSFNGTFLAVLFSGILISIASLAQVITYLLDDHPVKVWSFFFGLVVASVFLVAGRIKKWKVKSVVALLLAAGLAYWITIMNGASEMAGYPYIFLSGMVAICAMILPGISGSFILLLMGSYSVVLEAVSVRNYAIIIIFMVGCIVGLASFSRILSWLFRRFHDMTIAMLTGFLIGSLNKIWPWKNTLETRINSKGEQVPFIQENVLPDDQSYWLAIALALAGFLLIIVMEYGANKWKKNHA